MVRMTCILSLCATTIMVPPRFRCGTIKAIKMDMKTVSEIRRENMETLFERFKEYVWARWPNEPERGMMTRFANSSGMSPRYLSHIRNGRKEIGHDKARKMEAGMRNLGHEFDDVVDGWLDNDQARGMPLSPEVESLLQSVQTCYSISPLETQRALNELARRILLERVAKP